MATMSASYVIEGKMYIIFGSDVIDGLSLS
jgi:hypothetical protein